MDNVDQASQYQEIDIAVAQINHNIKPIEELARTGVCHNCGESVEKGQVFCSGGECQEDWLKIEASKKQRPR